MKVSCIYAHINKNNGMIYIGKTANYNKRMNSYKCNYHSDQPKFYNATQKYTWDNFIFGEIIELCLPEDLNKREKYWIRHLNTYDISNDNMGYNLSEGGEISPMTNPQTVAKISGVFHHMFGKRGKECPNFGKRLSSEQKNKISQSEKGKIVSKETIQKLSLSHIGQKAWNEGLTKENDLRIEKMANDKIGKNNPMFGKPASNRKSIVCVETEEKFDSIRLAAKYFNGQESALSAHLRNKKYFETFKGYTFLYA